MNAMLDLIDRMINPTTTGSLWFVKCLRCTHQWSQHGMDGDCPQCGHYDCEFSEVEPMDDGTNCNSDEEAEWDRFVSEVGRYLCEFDTERDDRRFSQADFVKMNIGFARHRSALSVAEEIAGL